MNKLDESLLVDLPPFEKLERVQIRAILDLASPARFGARGTIFEEGDVAEYFYLLLDGYVRVIRMSPDGEQVIQLHIPCGHLFGIASALGHTHYPATAQAVSECLCLRWPMKLLQEFLLEYPSFSAGVYRSVGKRVDDLNTRIMEMATQQVEQRIANALLRLIHQTGRNVESGVEIDFPITRQDISELTGSTLHTVSRMLSAWERDGIIKSTRRRVVVTNPAKLVLHAG